MYWTHMECNFTSYLNIARSHMPPLPSKMLYKFLCCNFEQNPRLKSTSPEETMKKKKILLSKYWSYLNNWVIHRLVSDETRAATAWIWDLSKQEENTIIAWETTDIRTWGVNRLDMLSSSSFWSKSLLKRKIISC